MPQEEMQESTNTPVDVEGELSPTASAEEAQDAPTTELEALRAEVDKLKADNSQYLDRLARAQAEFDNFRKRNLREQQEFRDYALTDTLKQLLPILDSLDRALKADNSSLEEFRSGVELIDRQFHDVLTRLGVEPIVAQGQPFDPALHQAIQMVESTEVEDNHVLEELQRGYRLRDRVLRAAMVRVAQHSNQ